MPNIGEICNGTTIGLVNRGLHQWLACEGCGKERWVKLIKNLPEYSHCQSCVAKTKTGPNHNSWKGGRKNQEGYILVYVSPDDFYYPMADKKNCIREHRLVMAKSLGRCLEMWEIVHHLNGDKKDNRLENLQLIGCQAEHLPDAILRGRVSTLENQLAKRDAEIAGLKAQISSLERHIEDITKL
jgi:hypothetical protein